MLCGNSTDLTSISLLAFTPIIPVKVYDNTDTQKGSIIDDNKGKSGVYRWVNKESGKSYVGSSTNLARRFKEYFNIFWLERYAMSIYKALLKYGYSGFKLEILEYCDPDKC